MAGRKKIQKEKVDEEIRQVNVPCLSEVHDISLCSGSRGSCKSSVRTESSRAKAELLIAQLKEQQVLRELELEKRQLKVRSEVEMAELRVQICEEEEKGENKEPRVDPSDKSEILSRYLRDCQASTDRERPIINAVKAPLASESKRAEGSQELPKVELRYFDGNVCDYWKFMKQFEYYIETRVNDDGQRFLYLLYYCKGRAHQAIEECVMLPPDLAYQTARGILKDLYGQSHVVARTLIDKLTTGLKPPVREPEALTCLSIRLQNCHIALTQMNYVSDLNSFATIEKVVRVLPMSGRAGWNKTADNITLSGRDPTFGDLCKFVATEARLARSRFGHLVLEGGPPTVKETRLFREDGRNELHRSALYSTQQRPSRIHQCLTCNKDHHLQECDQYLSMTVAERWALLRQHRACFNCLALGHNVNSCKLNVSCGERGCNMRHHHSLHWYKTFENNNPIVGSSLATGSPQSDTFLGIIPVRVKGHNTEIVTYAFLDNGSDTTLVCSNLVKRLGLKGDETSLALTTVHGTKIMDCELSQLEVRSMDGLETILIERAFTVSKLPVRPPVSSLNKEAHRWPHLREIRFDEIPGKEVSLLIGCDVPEAHWVIDQRVGERKQPFAMKTLLGWVLMGPSQRTVACSDGTCLVQRAELDLKVKLDRLYHAEFNDTESFGHGMSVEDKKALEIVSTSTTFTDGHFVVPLPWRGDVAARDNYVVAAKRLATLKSRLVRDQVLADRYLAAMNQNIKKGYVTLVPEAQLKRGYLPRWYLPHHPVFNPKKPDKLRIVLDCAAKFGELSLNDQLCSGPDTVSELIGVLMRFRLHSIALVADIEEMFMQVHVPMRDRGALRFLWWPDGNLNIQPREYQMIAHPFGATSSPFCANFALRKTVETFGNRYPENVSTAVLNNFYVDDCLVSLANVSEAKTFVHDITEMLAHGGFKLRKWATNSRDVLKMIPSSERASSLCKLGEGNEAIERTLGLEWDATSDMFCFRFEIPNKPVTRRGILSAVSSIFDPLGFVCPHLLPAKVILQKLCRCGKGWDDPLEQSDNKAWDDWVNAMRMISQLHIPRCIATDQSRDTKLQLHVFCDASEVGYGAVAYVRGHSDTTKPCCRIVFAKARVAPIKTTSIPRLELAAAVLAVKIFAIVRRNLDLEFEATYFWTDSMTVLYYINNSSTRFSTFVANRLTSIHEVSELKQWNHVPSANNVADLASRGTLDVARIDCWLEGPEFLHLPESSWPHVKFNGIKPDGIELKRPSGTLNVIMKDDSLYLLLHRYSNWMTLLRAVAWLRRFCVFLKDRASGNESQNCSHARLLVSEISHAKWAVLRYVQKVVYPNKDRLGERRSQLRKLCPVVIDGLICVGGRLGYTDYSNSRKHPVILPSKHIVTELIIRYYHAMEGHCGASQVLAAIRREFWVVQGATAVKRTVGNCLVCRRQTAHLCRQLMAPLPVTRVDIGWYPFRNVGVDYFGPFLVKRGRGTAKRYGCIFTCLQTRAVHLEVAQSLSTDAFIMVLMRFIARRGNPSDIYSDNGTNFVGATRELKGYLNDWDQSKLDSSLLNRGIQWHFQPPLSSHRGGIWERMIRSVRRILIVLSKEQTLGEEVLLTLMTEAERILNDRPLVPLTADGQDNIALTPNHLLLLRGNPGIDALDNLSARCSKFWRQAQYLSEIFWKRWSREYLTSLQTRQKWITKERNLKEGDVVIVASDALSRSRWPLGVVVECHPSPDGLVRTISIRTKGGVIKRDIRRVCLLEGSG